MGTVSLQPGQLIRITLLSGTPFNYLAVQGPTTAATIGAITSSNAPLAMQQSISPGGVMNFVVRTAGYYYIQEGV